MKITVDSKHQSTVTLSAGTEKVTVRNLHVGLCFPEGPFTGFYTIVGQGMEKGNPIYVVSEGTGNTMTELFKSLFEEMKKYVLTYIYCRLDGEKDREYVQEFLRYKRGKESVPNFTLKTNHYASNFILGVDLIYDHLNNKKLFIDEDSEIYRQLKIMTTEDKKPSHGSFSAIQALACSVGSYTAGPIKGAVKGKVTSREAWM